MRGRKPKPPDLRALQGNVGHRPVSSATAAFVAGAPDKPEWLDADGSAEWDRLIGLLCDESGVLSPADCGILICACEHYSAFRKASRILAEKGNTYETNGEAGTMIRVRPEVRMRQDALRNYQRTLTELGCTPTQHGRVRRLPDNQTEMFGIKRLLG